MDHPGTEVSACSEVVRLRTTYIIEGVLSFTGSLLFVGIFFYTKHQFQWGIVSNLLLAAGQGVTYVIATLATQHLANALGKRRVLLLSNIAMALVSGVGVMVSSPAAIIAIVVLYVPLLGVNWPVLESLAAESDDPHEMSRRVGLYNIVWASTAVIALAVQGTILAIDPRGVFFLPMLIHIIVVGIILGTRGYAAQTPQAPGHAHGHLAAEPELLRQRTAALWLSRISLPSTYVVIYSLSALMPLLPIMKSLSTQMQTPVGSVWMTGRVLAFGLLGYTVFWHTRPRLLLLAAVVMLLTFGAVTVAPSTLGGPAWLDLPLMIAAQLLLGLAMGLVYTASLYFGLVLSDASTEHAGYHEALIGLGQILGPGVGALTQWVYPGNLLAGVTAVSGIILLSVVAAAAVAIRAKRAPAES